MAGVTAWPVKAFRPSVGVSELGFEFHPLRHIILNFQGFHGGFSFPVYKIGHYKKQDLGGRL